MKILITGAAGTIGKVFMGCLSKHYEVVGLDKKPAQGVVLMDIIKEPDKLKKLMKNVEVVIHLAWDAREAGTAIEPIFEENKQMGEIMYVLSLEQKVKRFILASSVHVSFGFINYQYPNIVKDHNTLHSSRKIRVEDGFSPLGAYGASKVYLEALGRAYATRGLQIISVRFGNVTPDNNYGEYPFWLSHRDCCQFIEKCCLTENLPPFSTFFAISDNVCNPFDISEVEIKLGYKSQDSSPCPFKKI